MADNPSATAGHPRRVAAWLVNAPGWLDRAAGRIARRKRLAVAGISLFTLAVRLALLPIVGAPWPKGHDEFSYLLQADTFAHGRLTNPTHPLWPHFETFHVIQQPTYSSIYPPAQGLVLSAGQRLGHPWIGEWLITGLMCAALCWMLQGWLPAKWALYGATLASLRLGILGYWMNSYWSSSVVALGGALTLGALPRLTKEPRARDAFWLALGVALLANSRPYEGFVLAGTIAIALLIWMCGPKRPPLSAALGTVVAPAAGLLVLTALATGYYYDRVAGNPFRLTYQVDAQIYNPVPFFLWQRPPSLPAYQHETLRQFYALDLQRFVEHRADFLGFTIYRFYCLWLAYLDGVVALPLLLLPCLARDRNMRLPLLVGAVFVAALLPESWAMPHYAAPITGLLFLVIAQCARHLAVVRSFGVRWGRVIALSIPVLMSGALASRLISGAGHAPDTAARGWQRAALAKRMQALPGKHVVIVDYAPMHDTDNEWVYNEADIDAAKVVWARDMGGEKNRELARYYDDREIWRIVVDDRSTPELTRYPRDERTASPPAD